MELSIETSVIFCWMKIGSENFQIVPNQKLFEKIIDKLNNVTIIADIQRFSSKCVEQDKAFLSDAFSESFRLV